MCIITSPCIITHVINRIIIIINRDLLHRQKLEIYRNIYIYFFYYYFFPQAIGITYYLLIFNYTIATFSCYVCKAAFETICKKEEKKNACSAHIYVPSGLIISDAPTVVTVTTTLYLLSQTHSQRTCISSPLLFVQTESKHIV